MEKKQTKKNHKRLFKILAQDVKQSPEITLHLNMQLVSVLKNTALCRNTQCDL